MGSRSTAVAHAPPRRSIAPAARRHAHASACSQEDSSRPSGKSALVTRRLPGSTPAYWPAVPHSAPGWRFPRALLACRAAPARYSGRTWERHSGRAMGAAFTRPTGIAFGSAHARVDGVGQFNRRSARRAAFGYDTRTNTLRQTLLDLKSAPCTNLPLWGQTSSWCHSGPPGRFGGWGLVFVL